MQPPPVVTGSLAVDRIAEAEDDRACRACLPAGRIVLLRFSLAEVEPPTEDEYPNPLN